MRINSITNPSITGITNNNATKKFVLANQDTPNDTFETSQNLTFKSKLSILGRYKMAKYFKNDISYNKENIKEFNTKLDCYTFPSTSKQVKKFFEKAKQTITQNDPSSSGVMFAMLALLRKAGKKEIESIDKNTVNPVLIKYMEMAEKTYNVSEVYKNIDLFLDANPNLKFDDIKINNQPILFQACQDQDLDTLRSFIKRNDVNWNILNSKDNNIALESLADDWTFLIKLTELLLELPENKFNINYMNSQGKTLFSSVCNSKNDSIRTILIKNSLTFPNLDVNQKSSDGKPLYFKLIVNDDGESQAGKNFENCLLHPNFNDNTLNIPEINTKISTSISSYHEPLTWKKILLDVVNKKTVQKIKELYDENGIFTLEQIEKIVNYPNFNTVANMRYNIVGERLVHLLADIPMQWDDAQNIERLRKILDKMKAANCYFRVQDDFGRNALEKAKECENTVLIKLLQEYFHS